MMEPTIMGLDRARLQVVLLVLAGAAGSAGLGVLAGRSIPMAGALAALILVGVVTTVWPVAWFGGGVATLLLAPEFYSFVGGTPDQTPVYKFVLYAAVLPLLVTRGIRLRYSAPIAAYAICSVLSELGGTPTFPPLTTSETLSSLLTLCLGWTFFAVAWDWERDHKYLKLVAVLPVLSVAAGVLITPLGWSIVQSGSPDRLQGAVIAAFLGGLGFAATLASIILWRRIRWRHALPVGLAAVACTALSLGRGALLALLIGLVPFVYDLLREQVRRQGGATYLRLMLGGTVAAAVVVLGVLPALSQRAQSSYTYNPTTGVISQDASSGRFEAWGEYYKQAKENLVFGRGMGAGPNISIDALGFDAQHNEYLRLLLELGFVGVLIVLGAMILAFTTLIRSAPREIRADLTAFSLALLVFSATDNTLTSRHLAVPLLLTFALGAATAGGPVGTGAIGAEWGAGQPAAARPARRAVADS